ncbi:MAG TPA: hypothetical protein VHT24_08325 [Pseudacidobacterium sp.]|nr:hypothetical protein [Pseudacidobacterium sp.]
MSKSVPSRETERQFVTRQTSFLYLDKRSLAAVSPLELPHFWRLALIVHLLPASRDENALTD